MVIPRSVGHWRYIMVHESTRGIAIHKLAGYQKPRKPLCNEEGNKEHHLAMQQLNSKFILQLQKDLCKGLHWQWLMILIKNDIPQNDGLLANKKLSLPHKLVKWGHPVWGAESDSLILNVDYDVT